MELIQRTLLSLAITLLLALAAYATPAAIPKEQPATAQPGASRFNPMAHLPVLHRMGTPSQHTTDWSHGLKDVHPSSVIGTDDRVKVPNPEQIASKRPLSKVFMSQGDNLYICSGTLVSPRHLLTAGHCVFDPSSGWFTAFIIIPAMSGTNQPYGVAHATQVRAYDGWINNGDTNYDIALITLDSDIGDSTGYLQPTSVSFPNDNSVSISGYPGDLDGGAYMYTASGPISAITDNLLFYTIDTAGGESGSGIIMQDTNLVGVHTSGTNQFNFGTRINDQKLQDLNDWIAEDMP